MTIIVEDGTGKADAESYISVAEADAYHAKRLNTAWADFDTATKESLLIKATEYMVSTYRGMWYGYTVKAEQALDWPRYEVPDGRAGYIDSDIVPTEVKKACAELALKANAADLAPDLEQAVKREKVDSIEVEYESSSSQSPRYQAVFSMVSRYLRSAGFAVPLVRV